MRLENDSGGGSIGDDLENDSDTTGSSSSNVDEEEGTRKKNKRRKKVKYPIYNANRSSEQPDLYVGMQFKDKDECRLLLDNHSVRTSFNIKIVKGDKLRLQCICLGEGCNWKMWARKPSQELSFKVKTLQTEHILCIPFSFEQGRRFMSTDWLADHYKEAIRVQGRSLKARQLRQMVEKDMNYEPCFSMQLKAVLGDYVEQFSYRREYTYEIWKQNRD